MITKLVSLLFDFFLSISTLAEGAHAQAPQYLSKEQANQHATEALFAQRPGISAEILLAMAFVESRFSPSATSRVENGKRTTGIPRWSTPPKGVTGPFFCGVTQAQAGFSWKRCLELQDLRIAYSTTAEELRKWMRVCRNDLECALAGYGGGFPAIKAKTSTYPARVLSRARALRKVSAS